MPGERYDHNIGARMPQRRVGSKLSVRSSECQELSASSVPVPAEASGASRGEHPNRSRRSLGVAQQPALRLLVRQASRMPCRRTVRVLTNLHP